MGYKELSEEMVARAHAVSVFQYSNELLALNKKHWSCSEECKHPKLFTNDLFCALR